MNSVNCSITHLPSIKHEKETNKFSKFKAKEIDSLIALRNFQIELNNDDLMIFEKIIAQKDFNGNKIYDLSNETIEKIKSEKRINLNFGEINSLKSKSITDLISNVIDGSPFLIKIQTHRNKIEFNDNFAGFALPKNIEKYLIFYTFNQSVNVCGNSKYVNEYFSKENMIKSVVYCLWKIETN